MWPAYPANRQWSTFTNIFADWQPVDDCCTMHIGPSSTAASLLVIPMSSVVDQQNVGTVQATDLCRLVPRGSHLTIAE